MLSPASRVVHGRTQVEGWPTTLRRSVWMTRTGRIFAAPDRGAGLRLPPGRALRLHLHDSSSPRTNVDEPTSLQVMVELGQLVGERSARRERGLPVSVPQAFAVRLVLQHLQSPPHDLDFRLRLELRLERETHEFDEFRRRQRNAGFGRPSYEDHTRSKPPNSTPGSAAPPPRARAGGTCPRLPLFLNERNRPPGSLLKAAPSSSPV